VSTVYQTAEGHRSVGNLGALPLLTKQREHVGGNLFTLLHTSPARVRQHEEPRFLASKERADSLGPKLIAHVRREQWVPGQLHHKENRVLARDVGSLCRGGGRYVTSDAATLAIVLTHKRIAYCTLSCFQPWGYTQARFRACMHA
jgi:hypothetical protein